MGKGFTRQEMMDFIKRDEGYRESVYMDSVGVPTLGWGHALHESSFVPKEVCEIFFEHDFKRAEYQLQRLIDKYQVPLNSIRKFVILNMIFNLGSAGVEKFKKMWQALQQTPPDYEEAARQMLDSKWAGQVGKRATYLAGLMERGKK
jgi:lysozyme